MTRRKKIVIAIVAASVVLIGGVVAAGFIYNAISSNNKEAKQQEAAKLSSVKYENASADIENTGTGEAEVGALVKDYSDEYDKSIASINGKTVTPDKWTAEQVDQAYLSILYADKVGLSSQVKDLYYQIAGAKASGVNTEANSAHVTQAELDAMKARADASTSGANLNPEVVIQ